MYETSPVRQPFRPYTTVEYTCKHPYVMYVAHRQAYEWRFLSTVIATTRNNLIVHLVCPLYYTFRQVR